MSVAIQYFLNTNRTKLDDWYANQNTTTFGLWRNREVVLLKQDDTLLNKILWKIGVIFGLISQQSHPIEIIKEFYIQHKNHQILAATNTELTERISRLQADILVKQAECKTLGDEAQQHAQECETLDEERQVTAGELRAALKNLEKIQGELASKTVKLKTCTDNLAQAEAIISRAEQLSSQLAGLEKSIQVADKKSVKLNALIKRLEDVRDGIPGARLNPGILLELNTQRTHIEQGLIRLIENGTWMQVNGEKSLPDALKDVSDHLKQYKFKDLNWLETLQEKAASLKASTLTSTNIRETKNMGAEFTELVTALYTYSNTILSLAHTGYGLVL